MNSDKLTIVAKIWAKEGKSELVKEQLLNLIATTKTEEGCIDYDLHQDNEDEHVFLFFENWTTRELWQKHLDNDHIAAFKVATEDAIEKTEMNEMQQIG